ncbi:MAG: metallophosphoesterase [Desulfocapsa sp.]|nr:MAG: metallophosphoesterase [Desulfocapsa sp.]
MLILLLSDVHANFPALQAVLKYFSFTSFDLICNCGDSLVYGPFPNETLHWMQQNAGYSILGNTDRKVKKVLRGKTFNKPGKVEKRVMYTWTADQLDKKSKHYLLSQKKTASFSLPSISLRLFHGSPDHPNEFLFPNTPLLRFQELALSHPDTIIITGHSHTPYHKQLGSTHFINPGSVGRMFDSNPDASCAILQIKNSVVSVKHFRVKYDIARTVTGLASAGLPEIYQLMYLSGRKLN